MASRKVAGGGRKRSKVSGTRSLGRTPQVQSERRGAFNKDKREAFLGVLEDTCNVSIACREADVAPSTVYERRKIDAAFRNAWNEALATAYRKLELVLLERSFAGTERVVTKKDGSEERIREYPNAIALQLLKMHRETVVESERDYSEEETDELRTKILGKLKRLKARDFPNGLAE